LRQQQQGKKAMYYEYKTVSGSLAMFVGSIMGILILKMALLGSDDDDTSSSQLLSMRNIVNVSAIATIVEALTGAWDNVAVTLCIATYVRKFIAVV